jgi:hypothetical protein
MQSVSVLVIAIFTLIGASISLPVGHLQAYGTASGRPELSSQPDSALAASSSPELYLPLVRNPAPPLVPGAPGRSPFGVQPPSSLATGSSLSKIVELNGAWVRLADRISWRALQPNEGGPIHWELLADFELELRALNQAGITPVVIINYFPRWATILPTSCGAIRTDKLPAFAQFARALVARYHTDEFHVHHWEIGNEPDVDPSLVGPDNAWGCWGDIKDPFYGGRQYGEMLKVAGPAIKSEDPQAQVWIGGLLLDRPNTTDPSRGRSELFLQGILEAGAAPNFDIVAYHAYPSFKNETKDPDLTTEWRPLGGYVLGKLHFLRQIMSAYGVDKPLAVNEIALGCPPSYSWCAPPGDEFYQMQASFVVHAFVRGIDGGIKGFSWYSLNGPWRSTGLLDSVNNPRPAYYAYQQLAQQLADATYLAPVNYGAGVEAYAFSKGAEQLHIIWTNDAPIPITIPQSRFISATDRDGAPILPVFAGADAQLTASFAPIYVVCRP